MVLPRLPPKPFGRVRTAQPSGLSSVSPALLSVSHDQLYDSSPKHSRERLRQRRLTYIARSRFVSRRSDD